MPETTESLVADLGMDEEEEAVAARLAEGIQRMSGESDRSMQAQEFRVGVSDLGFCSERVRRMLLGIPEGPSDKTLAWIGTALGEHAEQAYRLVRPNALIQSEVSVPLQGERREYVLTGHPDIIEPDEALVIDVKTDYGTSTVRRSGPSQQQQFQRHLYGYGAWLEGLFGNVPMDTVRVANLWVDRAGVDRDPYVQMEPLSMDYVHAAAEWLDEVVYAYLETAAGREMEARKEPPREMCAVVCGHYETCRLFDTDVQGLIKTPETLAAIEMYQEGAATEKLGKKLKDEAKQHLRGVEGSTGTLLVRWTHVNETEVPASVRRGYDRLDIKPLPKGKK